MSTKPRSANLSAVSPSQTKADSICSELRTFHVTPEPGSGSVHATYLLSGELSSKHTNGDEMDIDDEMLPRENDGEQVPEVTVTLVGEQNLERGSIRHTVREHYSLGIIAVKSTYARIFSEHVHCLSPSPVIVSPEYCCPTSIYSTAFRMPVSFVLPPTRSVRPTLNSNKTKRRLWVELLGHMCRYIVYH